MKKNYVTSPYKDLKVNELVNYVNFTADDATPNTMTIDIIKKTTKNDKLLYQVIKLARQNNCYKIKETLAFLEYIEKRNTSKYFLKTDSEQTVDDD